MRAVVIYESMYGNTRLIAGPGLREWFAPLGHLSGRAAAFDTWLRAPAAVTGRASKGIAKNLRSHGFDMVAEPESFFVSQQNAVLFGETERAEAWDAQLAACAA